MKSGDADVSEQQPTCSAPLATASHPLLTSTPLLPAHPRFREDERGEKWNGPLHIREKEREPLPSLSAIAGDRQPNEAGPGQIHV